jgi:hypothetical protein
MATTNASSGKLISKKKTGAEVLVKENYPTGTLFYAHHHIKI